MKKKDSESWTAYSAYVALKQTVFDLFDLNQHLLPEEIKAIAIDMLHQSVGISHRELIAIWYNEWVSSTTKEPV